MPLGVAVSVMQGVLRARRGRVVRQHDAERDATAAEAIANFETAAEAMHGVLDDGQSKTRPALRPVEAVEALEDAFALGRWNAGAIVVDQDFRRIVALACADGDMMGMASGGLFGTGLGSGHPEITPFAKSDYIVASLAEELGLFGLFAILLMFVLIVERGLRTAIGVRDGFGKLLASGLVFTMAFQVFTVVGGITLVIPLTGLTLPYMAAGGSSLIANYMLAALLIVISNSANRPESEIDSDTFQQEAVRVLRERERNRRTEIAGNTRSGAAKASAIPAVRASHAGAAGQAGHAVPANRTSQAGQTDQSNPTIPITGVLPTIDQQGASHE